MRRKAERAVSVLCVILAIAQAVLVAYFGYVNYYRDYHSTLLIVAMVLGGLLSSMLCCIFHECGHILFGKLCRFRFNAMHVWFLHIVRYNGRVRIHLGRILQDEEGSAEMLPENVDGMRKRYGLVTAGGVLFSFLWFVGALLALIFANAAHFAVYVLVATSLPYAFYLFACNLLPFTDPPTDGAVLLGLIRGDASALTAVNLLSIEGYLMQGRTPVQIPENLYYGAPQLPEDDVNFILLTDYRLARAIDAGDVRAAVRLSDRLKELTEYIPDFCLREIEADVLFVECAVKQDREEAKRLYKDVKQYLAGERSIAAQRTGAAYALFVERDKVGCLRHLSAAQELADVCTIRGQAQYERKLLSCIKEELERSEAE